MHSFNFNTDIFYSPIRMQRQFDPMGGAVQSFHLIPECKDMGVQYNMGKATLDKSSDISNFSCWNNVVDV